MAVNMEAMMADAEAKQYIENVQNEMEKNAEINKLMDAASSLEDLYEVAKNYVVMKFEAFKALCKDAFEYFSKEDKVALSDETLEVVVGGSLFGDIWNKCKKAVVAVAVGVVGAAVFAGAGAVVLASGGTLAPAVIAGGAAIFGALGGGSAGMLQYLDNTFINMD